MFTAAPLQAIRLLYDSPSYAQAVCALDVNTYNDKSLKFASKFSESTTHHKALEIVVLILLDLKIPYPTVMLLFIYLYIYLFFHIFLTSVYFILFQIILAL